MGFCSLYANIEVDLYARVRLLADSPEHTWSNKVTLNRNVRVYIFISQVFYQETMLAKRRGFEIAANWFYFYFILEN